MSTLMAMDVALLPPADVSRQAIEYSANLPGDESERLQLDAEHLPHITLTQQFIRQDEVDAAFDRVDEVVRHYRPLRIHITGAEKTGHTVVMAIERTPDLVRLHEEVMEALRGFERAEGGPGSFAGGDGRLGDVLWVSGYRLKSSFAQYAPHITLGHAAETPTIEPFAFDATTVAACHLGRFCTCRHVLRSWTLTR